MRKLHVQDRAEKRSVASFQDCVADLGVAYEGRQEAVVEVGELYGVADFDLARVSVPRTDVSFAVAFLELPARFADLCYELFGRRHIHFLDGCVEPFSQQRIYGGTVR